MPPSAESPCRVLLVEDEPAARDGLAVLLDIEPDLSLVGCAASAEEALLLLHDLAPDVVLLDDRLGGRLTGVQAVPAFKELAPHAQVVLCTATPEGELGEHPEADGYVCKDDLVSLADLVRQACGRA